MYACGVSVNGVLDLDLMYDDLYWGFSRINRQVFNDRSDIASTSPLAQARNIRAPLLLVASEKDTVVPHKHSERLFRKLRDRDTETRYLELPDAEHWRTSQRAELTMLAAVEDFLARHLDTEARFTSH
jgi:dipeptidyl aminopeptidase/acylaminoacyl peptidase